jgi:hypothetical protein
MVSTDGSEALSDGFALGRREPCGGSGRRPAVPQPVEMLDHRLDHVGLICTSRMPISVFESGIWRRAPRESCGRTWPIRSTQWVMPIIVRAGGRMSQARNSPRPSVAKNRSREPVPPLPGGCITGVGIDGVEVDAETDGVGPGRARPPGSKGDQEDP